jgi:hypothetical protein
MKKGATPEFDVKWWKANQPKGLTKAKALEDALSDFSDVKEKLKKSGSEDDLKPCVMAIGKIRQAVEACMSEADKLKKSPPKGADADDLGNTSDALKKFARMYDSEKSELDKLVKEDEEDDNVFKDPDGYKKYLLKGLRKAGGGNVMNFSAVLGKKAGDHRIGLSASKGGAGLGAMLIKATGLHIMTFGTAKEDPDSPEGLQLHLEGKQLPGLKKKLDRMLKTFKPLPYSAVYLFVNGQEVEDQADPDDTDVDQEEAKPTATAQPQQQGPSLGQLRAAFEKIFPALKTLIQAGGPLAAQLGGLAKQFQAGIQTTNAEAAKAALDEIVAMMRTAGASTQATRTREPLDYAKLLDDWTKAHGAAQSSMDKLRAAILDEFKAEQELPAIQQNIGKLDAIMATIGTGLTDKLAAAQKGPEDQKAALNKAALDELRRTVTYVTSDALVTAVQDNPFTPVDLRGTLNGPLQRIEIALAA